MNRFAVFVDAGYLYAEGGKLCCDTASRDQFTVNARALTIMLRDEIQSVLRRFPRIPHGIDVELTRSVAGSLHDDQEARNQLRQSFWRAVQKHASLTERD